MSTAVICKTCPKCAGNGTLPMPRVYAATYDLVAANPRSNGATLAALAKCRATAMNNRLRVLGEEGHIWGERRGRQILWAVAFPANPTKGAS